jgi:hypothetical protein
MHITTTVVVIIVVVVVVVVVVVDVFVAATVPLQRVAVRICRQSQLRLGER